MLARLVDIGKAGEERVACGSVAVRMGPHRAARCIDILDDARDRNIPRSLKHRSIYLDRVSLGQQHGSFYSLMLNRPAPPLALTCKAEGYLGCQPRARRAGKYDDFFVSSPWSLRRAFAREFGVRSLTLSRISVKPPSAVRSWNDLCSGTSK